MSLADYLVATAYNLMRTSMLLTPQISGWSNWSQSHPPAATGDRKTLPSAARESDLEERAGWPMDERHRHRIS